MLSECITTRTFVRTYSRPNSHQLSADRRDSDGASQAGYVQIYVPQRCPNLIKATQFWARSMDAQQLKVRMPADPKKHLDFSYDTLYWEKDILATIGCASSRPSNDLSKLPVSYWALASFFSKPPSIISPVLVIPPSLSSTSTTL
jgi:hypothetical protein